MAEAIDRPAGSEQQGISAPSVAEGAAPGQAPPSLPEPEVYRPLSLVALAGFGLAVLYAAVIGVSSLVALFNRAPLLLPTALFLVPLAAAVLSWVGRNQVRASEGTRSGAALALWGIRLSLICGLLYAGYVAGTYFAVRQQAIALADQWMDLLRNDELARAYRLTILPAVRPADDARLLAEIEGRYNDEAPQAMSWNRFRQSEFRALFRQGGQAVQAQPLGVTEWDFDKGTYQVMVRYRIATPDLTCEAVVALAGSRAPAEEYEGREWQVLADRSRIEPETVRMTPQGEQRARAAMEARSFADKWVRSVTENRDQDSITENLNQAWLGTLPAAERPAAAQVLPRSLVCGLPALSGTAVLGGEKDADRDRVVSRVAFDAGSLVREDKNTYWTTLKNRPELKEQMPQALRQIFAAGTRHRFARINLAPTRLPIWEEKDGVLRVSFPGQVTTGDHKTGAEFAYEIELVVEATASGPQADRRIHSLYVVNGHPAQPRPGPGQGPPGGPPRPR